MHTSEPEIAPELIPPHAAEPADGSVKHDDLWAYVRRARPSIEQALETHLPLAPDDLGTRFNDALRWSLFPGGKRLRPVLTLLGAEIVGGRAEDVLPAAAAVEYIHTSSLIFDDLPCMDDAPERRGRESVHMRYGQGLAVLVALALMNTSYGLIFEAKPGGGDGAANSVKAHREFVECIGTNGMVTGQTIDLAAAGETNAPAQIRNLKTSALMRMALRTGAMLAGGADDELATLSSFAAQIGEAYQMRDDLLDTVEDRSLADGRGRANTEAAARGAALAARRAAELVSEAKSRLANSFGDSAAAHRLAQFADYVVARTI